MNIMCSEFNAVSLPLLSSMDFTIQIFVSILFPYLGAVIKVTPIAHMYKCVSVLHQTVYKHCYSLLISFTCLLIHNV